MKLSAWMKRKNMTISGFSRSYGMGKATVWRLARRQGTPSGHTMFRIENITDGEVAVRDMMPKGKAT